MSTMQIVDAGTKSTTSHVTANDGTRLLVRHWVSSGHPWGSVLLVHGVSEHSGRYDRTARVFAEAGVDVTAFDLCGHGGSGGRSDVERWTDYLDDIELMLGRVRSADGARPVALLGHSMSGLLCAEFVLGARPMPDILVLSAPGLDDLLPRWQHALAGPRISDRAAPGAQARLEHRGAVSRSRGRAPGGE